MPLPDFGREHGVDCKNAIQWFNLNETGKNFLRAGLGFIWR